LVVRVVGIASIDAFNDVLLHDIGWWELIPHRDPPWMDIMTPPKQLNLPGVGVEPFDHLIDLIGLSAGLTHFGHDDITIHLTIHLGITMHTNQAMLLAYRMDGERERERDRERKRGEGKE